MDDDRNRKLSKDEFRKGVEEYGLHFTKTDVDNLFRSMDTDQTDTIDFEEFLRRLRVGNMRLSSSESLATAAFSSHR